MNQPKLTLLSSASNPGLRWSCSALTDPNITPGRGGHSTLGGVILPWGSFHPPTSEFSNSTTQNFTCVEKMVALRCAQGSAFGGKFNWRECQGCLLNLAESRPTPMT